MTGIRGVLFDIDGVLVTSWHPIGGAADALIQLSGLPRAFLTNTTSSTRSDIAQKLTDCGMSVDVDEVLTAGSLTAEYLKSHHAGARCWILNSGSIDEDFAGIELTDDTSPDVVVLGGAGPEFSHLALSRVAELMLDGIPVIAMHRARTWMTTEGLRLDVGGYLPGLEEAGNAAIPAIGKPSTTAFETAAGVLGVPIDSVLMIGDDVEADVQAAQKAGLIGVLVRTGKYRVCLAREANPQPDYIIDSIAQLPDLIAEL
ncbi:HAD-IIA family hydrolase [Smaragdicoccus niigatensis]|uniref:HAD-IIA family hydrolase n=1 Tax=Smaragdicoccus niigatensis TaxID=359359 RepID=UPI00035F3173|nr:HAD-IIA family hydrolase [Smaragdicoccus niigatensis]